MKYFISVVCLVLVLTNCSFDKKTDWIMPVFDEINCDDYANHKTEFGILNNNVWNKNAAGENTWKQCLVKKSEDGKDIYGWFWTWPSNKRTIYAYPQIKQGSSPWAPEPKFRHEFPLEIASLVKLESIHHLETETNGTHNTATSLWLTDSPYSGNRPNSEIISAEVMIWTYSTKEHFSPAGRKIDEITINDRKWEVWHQKNWEDQSGNNQNKWTIISFKAKENTKTANIDILRMLRYAENNDLINKGLFVADIELGNEIMAGSGIAWVKQFEVIIE